MTMEDVDERIDLLALRLAHRVAHERFACAFVPAARDHLALSLQRYKPVKWSLVGTANQAPCREVAATRIYFGRMLPGAE